MEDVGPVECVFFFFFPNCVCSDRPVRKGIVMVQNLFAGVPLLRAKAVFSRRYRTILYDSLFILYLQWTNS